MIVRLPAFSKILHKHCPDQKKKKSPSHQYELDVEIEADTSKVTWVLDTIKNISEGSLTKFLFLYVTLGVVMIGEADI